MADHDENVDVDIWYVDLGASTHMTGKKNWFKDFKEINEGAQIYLGDDRSHQITVASFLASRQTFFVSLCSLLQDATFSRPPRSLFVVYTIFADVHHLFETSLQMYT